MIFGLKVDKNSPVLAINAPDMFTVLKPNLCINQLTIGPDKWYTPFIKDPIHETVDLLESKLSIKGPRRTPNEVTIPSNSDKIFILLYLHIGTYIQFMSGSCHLHKVLNDEFDVEDLF